MQGVSKVLEVIIAVLAVLPVSCGRPGFEPEEGDLLFQVEGTSDFSAAIADVTAGKDSLRYVHVAIATKKDGKIYALEASSEKGVVLTGLDEFLAESRRVNGCPGVVVKRLNTGFPVERVIESAYSHIGEEYDWSYLPDNGKMYCSELVYEAFRDETGVPLFTASPMNFRDGNGEIPEFWIKTFEKLGEPVPEGVPGTNPCDMAREPVLTEVHRYF